MRKMIIIAMTMLMAVNLHAQQPANRQQAMQRIEQQVRHYSEVFELNEEQAHRQAFPSPIRETENRPLLF